MINEFRKQWPVKGLYYINSTKLNEFAGSSRIKLIDIREAPDYYKNHIEGSIHIYVGRLPFVWANHIQPGDEIVLLGRNRRSIHKAARILRKKAGMSTKIAAHIFTPHRKEGREGIDGKAEINHCAV